MSYLKIRLNSGMNRNSDRVSGSGLPNPELSKTPFRFRLNRSRILNVSGIRPDIPVPSRAYMQDMWRMLEHDNLSNVQTQQFVMNAKPLKIAIYKNFN